MVHSAPADSRKRSPKEGALSTVPHQQRHLHRHQRPGGPALAPWAGWPRCRSPATWWARRCRPCRCRGCRRAGAGSARSSSACWWPPARRRCARWRPGTGNFWLLVGATLVAGFYSANGALYRFAGPSWWRLRTASGAVVGAGRRRGGRLCRAQPGQRHARPARRALCRRLPGAGGRGDRGPGGDELHPLPARVPPVAGAPAGRRSPSWRASRPSWWPSWLRRWATA
jgi:hypothetical protein